MCECVHVNCKNNYIKCNYGDRNVRNSSLFQQALNSYDTTIKWTSQYFKEWTSYHGMDFTMHYW